LRGSSVSRLGLSMTSMRRLGNAICGGCSDLREVLLPRTLEEIGVECFGSSGLSRLDLSLTNVVEMGRGACLGCSNLRDVIVPTCLERVRDRCFEGTAIARVSLGAASEVGLRYGGGSVTTVGGLKPTSGGVGLKPRPPYIELGRSTFASCHVLEEVCLPANVEVRTHGLSGAFRSCGRLGSLDVGALVYHRLPFWEDGPPRCQGTSLSRLVVRSGVCDASIVASLGPLVRVTVNAFSGMMGLQRVLARPIPPLG
jgi:hypothetical protein